MTLSLLFGKNMAREKQVMLATAIIIMGVAVVLTGSRGGLLGFGSVFLFIILLNFLSGRWSRDRRYTADPSSIQRKVAIAAAGVALIIVIFGVVLFVGGNDSLLRGIGVAQSNVDISSGRLHFWPIAISIFLEHPIFGAGFDAFGVAFTGHDTWSGALRVDQAHNEYLQTLADSGLAGFICITGFIYLLFRKGLRTMSDATGFRREAAVGALAGCFGILIHSFFDFPLRTPSNAFFFLLLCAIATVPIGSVAVNSSRRSHSKAP
jgi:O-antigen ligase